MARCRKRQFPNPDARNEMQRISLGACGYVVKIKAGNDLQWTEFLRAGTLSAATFALVNCTAISAISAWALYQRKKGWFALNCFPRDFYAAHTWHRDVQHDQIGFERQYCL
jgi:hypothetical protein